MIQEILKRYGVPMLLGATSYLGTASTELTCSRSSFNECSLVRNTPLLRMSPIKIIDPLAVDVITHRHRNYSSYSAEIRTAHISYTLPILSSYNYNPVQDAADKVNNFLLRSDAESFFGSFPEKAE